MNETGINTIYYVGSLWSASLGRKRARVSTDDAGGGRAEATLYWRRW